MRRRASRRPDRPPVVRDARHQPGVEDGVGGLAIDAEDGSDAVDVERALGDAARTFERAGVDQHAGNPGDALKARLCTQFAVEDHP